MAISRNGIDSACWQTYIVSPHIDFRQPVEVLSIRHRLHDLLQREVHPGVAVDEVAVERLPILELDQHWVADCRVQKA